MKKERKNVTLLPFQIEYLEFCLTKYREKYNISYSKLIRIYASTIMIMLTEIRFPAFKPSVASKDILKMMSDCSNSKLTSREFEKAVGKLYAASEEAWEYRKKKESP